VASLGKAVQVFGSRHDEGTLIGAVIDGTEDIEGQPE
jgi:hypothetical protein